MKKIYTGIDIGTDSIKFLVAEMYQGKLRVLASSSIPTKGLKYGLIVDPSEVLIGLRKGIKEVEGKVGVQLDKALVTLLPFHAEYTEVTGYSTITNDDHKVSGDDILRAMQASIYNKVVEERELASILPVSFAVDTKTGVKDPKGMVGQKLTVQAVMVTLPKKIVHSVVGLIESLGVRVVDVTVHPICDYYEFKNKDAENKTVALINVGHETTTVSVFEKGVIGNSEVLNLGGKNVDNDIAYIYKCSLEDSRLLKERFALANVQFALPSETYELLTASKREISINQHELSEIVMSRIVEILKLAKKQANLLTKKQIDYIIITGGSSEIPGLSSIINEIFGNKAKIAIIDTMGIRENRYSPVSGLVRYFHHKMVLRGKEYSMLTNEEEELLVTPHKNLENNKNVLSKIFGYFFE